MPNFSPTYREFRRWAGKPPTRLERVEAAMLRPLRAALAWAHAVVDDAIRLRGPVEGAPRAEGKRRR